MGNASSQPDDLSAWPGILDAARRLAARGEWRTATMDDLAREAGVSRVTLYRRGASRARVAEALRQQLAQEERVALWPAVTGDGTGRERLEAALLAYCGVSERHLELFEIVADTLGDTVYHEAGDDALTRGEFTEPIRRLLLDGAADGSLRQVADVDETATVVYNTVGWIYQHLRRGHRWTPGRAAHAVVSLVVDGLAA